MEGGVASVTLSQVNGRVGQWYKKCIASVNVRVCETGHEHVHRRPDAPSVPRERGGLQYTSPAHWLLQPRCSPAEDGPCSVLPRPSPAGSGFAAPGDLDMFPAGVGCLLPPFARFTSGSESAPLLRATPTIARNLGVVWHWREYAQFSRLAISRGWSRPAYSRYSQSLSSLVTTALGSRPAYSHFSQSSLKSGVEPPSFDA